MLALRFTQTKNFMERLLLSPAFDRFLLSEASITTAATVSIDGHFHPDFTRRRMRKRMPLSAPTVGLSTGNSCVLRVFS